MRGHRNQMSGLDSDSASTYDPWMLRAQKARKTPSTSQQLGRRGEGQRRPPRLQQGGGPPPRKPPQHIQHQLGSLPTEPAQRLLMGQGGDAPASALRAGRAKACKPFEGVAQETAIPVDLRANWADSRPFAITFLSLAAVAAATTRVWLMRFWNT